MLPLEGIRILDLTRVLAGPYCTWILATLGATVIKVEQPGKGDQARDIPPFVNRESVYYMSLNRGKQGITLDLKRGGDVARRLAAGVDVLVENFAPGVTDRLGLGYAALAAENSRLIYASISGFGQTGPARDRRAYDQIVQALTGVMSITGEPDRPPLRVGFSIGDLAAGLFAATGILGALRQRDVTGVGQYLDIGMLESVLALLENPVARYLATGEVPAPLGHRHPTVTPVQAFEAADGWFVVAAGNNDQWVRFCQAIDHPELATDSRFVRNPDRTARRAELEAILQDILRGRTRTEWIERLAGVGVPAAPIHSVADAVNWEQTRARGAVVDVCHPTAGQTQFVGFPVQFSGAETDASRPAPILGQHTDHVLAQEGFSPAEIAALRDQGVI